MSDTMNLGHHIEATQITAEASNSVRTLGLRLGQALRDVRQIQTGRDLILEELKEMTAARDAALLMLELLGDRCMDYKQRARAAGEHRKVGEFSTPLSPAIIAALEKCAHALEDIRTYGLPSRAVVTRANVRAAPDSFPRCVAADAALQAWTDARAETADVERLQAAAEGSSDE